MYTFSCVFLPNLLSALRQRDDLSELNNKTPRMSKQQPLRTPTGRLTKASKQSQAVANMPDIRTLFEASLPPRSFAVPANANDALPRPTTLAIAVAVEPAITRCHTLPLPSSVNMSVKAVVLFSSSPPVNAPATHCHRIHVIYDIDEDDYPVEQDQDLEVRVSFVQTLSEISCNHSTI
ncbi:hypothetical protein BC830DRAFT_1157647, partial [Chytriomyces sp. MP71]